jgi:long-subunit fatty acid transport protein
MIVSLSFQRLFDFDRDWNFALTRKGDSSTYTDRWDFRQDGALSALGLSYCAQILPRRLSVGFTFNVWDDDLTENSWKQVYNIKRTLTSLGTPYFLDYRKTRDYSLEGINANIGILWNVGEKLTVGAVLKTPFTADIDYREHETLTDVHPTYPTANRQRFYRDAGKSELKMPMSYGLGVRWEFSQSFMVAFDIYRTEWDDFTFENAEGEKISPITGLSMDETDTEPTVQARLGAEYLFTDKYRGIAIPLRCGVFYDPAPAQGSPDDFFGFSLGAGFTKNEWFSFDVAYQFRFGDNVGASLFPFESFSQNVREHKVYASVIVYWPGNFRKKPFGI